ncbi:outer membrane protein TolC [Ancylomarina subtilis]|uniref:Outer membrane protein TolC n=1 Tax=Ancylomarina subtilis TaxID=1639035 RepID=A0A4Q7VME9_9BACT|nr:TolC family protein [Ancylomarina subtilis]RZT97490.1 outer membrane protein TolC [Ancylomarina subtilis]
MRHKIILAVLIAICMTKPSISQEVLSLDKCRTLAKEHNQDVRNAAINVAIYESQLKSNKTNLLPKLDFSASLTRLGDPQVIQMPAFELPKVDFSPSGVLFPGGKLYEAPENLYKLNLSLIQPIYMGGKLRNLNKLSQKQVDLSKENLRLEQSDLLLTTDETYWTIVSLKEKLILTRESIKFLEEFKKDINNFYEVGLATKNDVLQAQVNLNHVTLANIEAENGFDLANMSLNRLIGLPLWEKVQLEDSVVNKATLPDFEVAHKKALAQRPELKMSQLAVDMRELGVKMTRADQLPSVNVGVNGYYGNPNHFGVDEGEKSWNATAMVKIPVLHWGEKRQAVKRSKMQREQAVLELEKNKDLIALDVQQSLYALKEAISKMSFMETSLEQAEENLNVTRNNFSVGVASVTQVLDAQVSWQLSYSKFIDAKIACQQKYSVYLKAIGELDQI